MRNMQRIASVVLGLILGALTASHVAAAEVTNTDCEHAQSFCDDVYFPFREERFQGCLWFSFEVDVVQSVAISCSSIGGKFGLQGPYDPQSDPCRREPPPSCAGQYMDLLTIGEVLEPGIYFITVGYPSGIPHDVEIDVTRGLGCDGEIEDPTNIDCGSAISFCSDISQEFSQDWANHYNGCLWYSFTLDEPSDVQISIQSPGSKIHLHPVSHENPCPPCGSSPLMSSVSTLDLNGMLPAGQYLIAVSISTGTPGPVQIEVAEGLECLPCDGCIPPFELDPKTFYIITAWAHVPGQPGDLPSFTTPKIVVESPPGTFLASFIPSGPIIDGWQRIEGVFETPNPYQGLEVEFTATSGAVHYDDIRIMPEKASMKCYVYDPENLRFVAELDERHYATFYEYDGEGKLTRVKKETERGVMTIQETRNSSSKLFGP